MSVAGGSADTRLLRACLEQMGCSAGFQNVQLGATCIANTQSCWLAWVYDCWLILHPLDSSGPKAIVSEQLCFNAWRYIYGPSTLAKNALRRADVRCAQALDANIAELDTIICLA